MNAKEKVPVRTEFSFARTVCACDQCRAWCKSVPGYLIPSDLSRMMPQNDLAEAEKIEWARCNLRASPGAVVVKDGIMFRIPTLVPAVKSDGSCIYLDADERCRKHEVAPMGCAFFDCKSASQGDYYHLSGLALQAILVEHLNPLSLYRKIWLALWKEGKRALKPEDLIDGIGKVE